MPTPRSPRELLRLFHGAMAAKSADDLADLYAVDAVHEFSFYTPHRPPVYEGREAVRDGYRDAWRDHPLEIHAIRDIFIYDTTDPEVVIGQWELCGALRLTGAPVRVTGLLVLRARDGQIIHLCDFMDVLGVSHAIGRAPFSPPAGPTSRASDAARETS